MGTVTGMATTAEAVAVVEALQAVVVVQPSFQEIMEDLGILTNLAKMQPSCRSMET
jgi:hypothetical protein